MDIYADKNYIEKLNEFCVNFIKSLYSINGDYLISNNGRHKIPLKPKLGKLN